MTVSAHPTWVCATCGATHQKDAGRLASMLEVERTGSPGSVDGAPIKCGSCGAFHSATDIDRGTLDRRSPYKADKAANRRAAEATRRDAQLMDNARRIYQGESWHDVLKNPSPRRTPSECEATERDQLCRQLGMDRAPKGGFIYMGGGESRASELSIAQCLVGFAVYTGMNALIGSIWLSGPILWCGAAGVGLFITGLMFASHRKN